MQISLPPEWERFIAEELKGGVFHSPTEVVSAGLMRLKQDQEARLPEIPSTLLALEADIEMGLADIERGGAMDGNASLELIRRQIKNACANG